MSSNYPSDWDSRRKQVYKRDNFQCQNCGREGGPVGTLELHAHHIVPIESGGTHKTSNLISVCGECHNAIHNNSLAPTADMGTARSNIGPKDLSDIISQLKEFLEYAQDGLEVESPGQIKHDKLEQQRTSLIQKLGKLSIKYDGPDDTRQAIMDDMIQSYIQLLRYPEDVWSIMKRDNLSRDQTKRLGEELTEDRGEDCSEAMSKFIEMGPEGFFK